MTGQDMIDEMHDHEFEDLADTRLLALLNDQYQDVCSRFLWPFLETETDITVNSDGTVTGWPADLAQPKRLYDPIDTSFTNIFDNRNNFTFLEDSSPQLRTGFSGKTLTLVYYKIPANLTLSTSPLIPAKHHRVVVLGALSRAYYMTDDSSLGQLFEQQYENRIRTMGMDLLRKNVAPRRIRDIWADC